MSWSEPNPKEVSACFEDAYTHRRWSRLNGRSSLLFVTMY